MGHAGAYGASEPPWELQSPGEPVAYRRRHPLTVSTISQRASPSPKDCAPVVCARRGRLDPGLLKRAVGLLLDGHPELWPSVEGARAGRGVGLFVHLDLSRSLGGEQPGVEETVEWMLRRCLDRGSGAPFQVVYLDPGVDEPGRLVLAGRRGALSDGRGCAALSEALLRLYGELTAAEQALA